MVNASREILAVVGSKHHTCIHTPMYHVYLCMHELIHLGYAMQQARFI